jgi:hypothetical protein
MMHNLEGMNVVRDRVLIGGLVAEGVSEALR